MKLDKVSSINSLLEKASRMAADLKLGENKLQGQTEIDLLSLLFQIQSLVISIRAERCLDQFVAEYSHETQNTSYNNEGADIIPWDRRQIERDRRKLRTYLADDRRTGFADRRKKRVG